jgi:hypothetical protein
MISGGIAANSWVHSQEYRDALKKQNTVAKKVIIYNAVKTDYCVPAQAPVLAGPHARLNIRQTGAIFRMT